ncbi:hypothetical protein [Microbacterium sp. zg.Y909]|uniref:hypothetical protein n=1 Tax=Microbacterium sp. zg.Y909 TaxID=2969413 RepID=UPI00214BF8BD|nr:hypothetical protein [Microbacterium sp. zg.Y909]MCR2824971.1 hypothetical protein [Microbacterium sp. zg.Y909]
MAGQTIIGVFLIERTLRSRENTEAILDLLAGQQVSDVFVELRNPPEWLADECRARGMRLIIAMTCFFDEDLPAAQRPSVVVPINAEGIARPKLEWYTGAVPTDDAIAEGLASRAVKLLETSGADGLALDFIRWPMHWEVELRAGTSGRDTASFDATTIAAFNERAGLSLPTGDARAAAAIILASHADEWEAFRAQVIDGIVAEIASAVRKHSPSIWLAAFLVPLGERERIAAVGQSAAALSNHLDALLPMAYHAMTGRGTDDAWTQFIEVRAHAPSTCVVPVVQTTASPEFSGQWDWGTEFDFGDLVPTLMRLRSVGDGFILFPGESVSADDWGLFRSAVPHE